MTDAPTHDAPQHQPQSHEPLGGDAPAIDHAGRSRPRRSRDRVVVGLLLVLLAALVASVGIAFLHRPPSFCAQVSSLPALRDHLSDGTPAPGLEDYAKELDALADRAPTSAARSAARRLAEYDRSLAAMVSGVGGAEPVLAGADSAAEARAVLDREISRHC